MNGLPNWQYGFTQKRVKGVTEMVIPYGARNERIPKTGTRSKMSKRVGVAKHNALSVKNDR